MSNGTPIRNPRWRRRQYLKYGGISLVACLLAGWFSDGMQGIVASLLTWAGIYLVSVLLWELGERHRDREHGVADE